MMMVAVKTFTNQRFLIHSSRNFRRHISRGGETYSRSKQSTGLLPFDYDLVVIGGGSGGLACAKEASSYNKRVAVLDYVNPSPQGSKWGLGGTCVNVGCIPKKLMHQAAILGRAIKDSSSYGWSTDIATSAQHNWSSLVGGVHRHVLSLNWGYRVQLHQKNIDYFNSYGRFIDEHTIELSSDNGDKRSISAANIVLAVGCRPVYPDQVSGAVDYGITSDDIFTLKNPPGKTLVVGASYVALECAGFLQGLGHPSSVMIRSKPLKGFDQEMSELVVHHMEGHEGVNIMRGCVPLSVRQSHGTESPLTVQYRDHDHNIMKDTWNTVVFATGRRPLLSSMDIDNTSISVGSESGRVMVDDRDCTSVPHIYAIGDVAENRPELTPVAIKAGKMLARRLFGGSSELMDYNTVPTTVFTPLELSYVGLNEAQAIDQYGEDNIEVYHAYYKPLEYYLPDRDASHCYIKMVAVRQDADSSEVALRVLGLHITGPNTGEIIQGFAVAMRCGSLTVNDVQSTVGVHPTIAEEIVKLNITKRSGRDPTVTGC